MFCINYESKLIYPNNSIQTALDIDRITTDRHISSLQDIGHP